MERETELLFQVENLLSALEYAVAKSIKKKKNWYDLLMTLECKMVIGCSIVVLSIPKGFVMLRIVFIYKGDSSNRVSSFHCRT